MQTTSYYLSCDNDIKEKQEKQIAATSRKKQLFFTYVFE